MSLPAAIALLVTFWVRLFGITAAYHRYLAHRSFRTSRVFQFALAWLGASAGQNGPLWWVSHHRLHHRHADSEDDIHSPGLKGFWWAHAGWIMSRRYDGYDTSLVKDLRRFPELRLLGVLLVGGGRDALPAAGAGEVAAGAGSAGASGDGVPERGECSVVMRPACIPDPPRVASPASGRLGGVPGCVPGSRRGACTVATDG